MILETIEGFLGVDYDTPRKVFIVTFDDQVTSVGEIIKTLKENGYRVKGRPILTQ
ncbi:MAG TPA: heavy-metal-associated domain-containing protein [Syntrophales bacterium]|nr:heavy-metal-associated domain-containing protein [Syntrophales bacterium]HOX93772.1 heavy-metal-associated domain-containing protein [Syntrophales bacterium]HPI57721.1 heavy-metal-associated domain-containing protein [Syntrophales bacterium]HPN23954.1 heavy-metal-associated domain-containing protein [Syntrophales bacterium]HQM28232.1 heavy-metal-associated domain-containing protein [Syntrophales bacterium]